jgi:hypothetical protein
MVRFQPVEDNQQAAEMYKAQWANLPRSVGFSRMLSPRIHPDAT